MQNAFLCWRGAALWIAIADALHASDETPARRHAPQWSWQCSSAAVSGHVILSRHADCPCVMLFGCMCNHEVVREILKPAALSGGESLQGASKPAASRCCAAFACGSSQGAWMSRPYLFSVRLAYMSKHPWPCTLIFGHTEA